MLRRSNIRANLYEYAREGIEVEAKRRVHHRLRAERARLAVTSWCWTSITKGTYIRTIIDDMGELLGRGARLSCTAARLRTIRLSAC